MKMENLVALPLLHFSGHGRGNWLKYEPDISHSKKKFLQGSLKLVHSLHCTVFSVEM